MASEPIKVTRDGQAMGEIPCERIPLHYPNMSWRADPAIGMDARGNIYCAIRMRVFASSDGGISWKSREVDLRDAGTGLSSQAISSINVYDSFGVLRNGGLLWAYAFEGRNYLLRSGNGGKSWEPWSKIEETSPYPSVGGNQNCITELSDKSIVWPTRLSPVLDREMGKKMKQAEQDKRWEGPPGFTTYVYRSTDMGMTWPQKAMLQPWGVETSISELQSGRLIAAIRYQRFGYSEPPVNEPPELSETDSRSMGGVPGWVGKRVFFADSDDGGLTWKGFRPLWRKMGGEMELEFGEAHAHVAQLADGRVIVVYEHRYPHDKGGIRAKVSHDGGQTWRPEVYHLDSGSGYAASAVLEDQTIVTICGNTPMKVDGEPTAPWQAEALRWHLPDNA